MKQPQHDPRFEWVDPELIAAGESFGDAPATPRKNDIEKITLDHWRVKEWTIGKTIVITGRSKDNEVIVITNSELNARYDVLRFFIDRGIVEAQYMEKDAPTWKVFEILMTKGGFTTLKATH